MKKSINDYPDHFISSFTNSIGEQPRKSSRKTKKVQMFSRFDEMNKNRPSYKRSEAKHLVREQILGNPMAF